MIHHPSSIIKILLIEDNPGDTRLIREMLAEAGCDRFDLVCVDQISTGLEHLARGGIGLVLLDLSLPDSYGLGTLRSVRAQAPAVPIIVLTDLDDETLAIKIFHEGAQDYLVKGKLDSTLLASSSCRAIERHRMLVKIEQKALELQTNESRFRTMIENNVDGIVIVDRNGTIRFINPAAESFFNHKKEELIGELFGFPLTVGKGTEIDIIGKGGKRAVAEMRAVETVWYGERAYLASLRDITELNRAIEKVKLLANLVENASYVMILIVQPDGRIMECNALTTSTFGYSKSEMLAQNMGALFKLKADEGWEKIADLVNLESHWRGELTAVCKEGREFPVDMAASRSESEETGSANIICFIRDVSKEKEVDRMKSEFISLASHEMRTPMTSIKNAVDIMLKGKAGEISDTQEKFLSMAKRNICRLTSLINDLLDISKIESAKMELNYSELDIRDCIENVMDTSKPLADEKSITLKMSSETDFPVIYADACRIEQVMINLVGNAIKFTPESGTVRVDVHEVKDVSDMHEGVYGFLDISVTDNGVGIPEEVIDHIFNKFYQVESSLSTEKQTGSGLGLAISKYIVEAHGGNLQCKSKKGEGSTFSLTLPIFDNGLPRSRAARYQMSCRT